MKFNVGEEKERLNERVGYLDLSYLGERNRVVQSGRKILLLHLELATIRWFDCNNMTRLQRKKYE